ncbi:MAG: ABC transporter ATP-binding protein [Candidatus Pelethousia sp.]|nr:ABC transporter ATP-binding protein [Candidatus Pelethousia sp.]
MNALELKNVCKAYKGFSLKDVSFGLPEGYIMGFIGENGAGKSTTIKAILGLVHSEGEICVLGRDKKEITAVKEHIGVVLEEATFPDQLNLLDVEAILRGVYKTWDRARFLALTDTFRLDRKKKIKDYSRGMKMKLALAAALSHDSRLLILDEPTAGLDPVVRDEVLDILLEFIQQPDHTVLISSHIISDLERVCDYVTFIHEGRILFSLSKEALSEEFAIFHGGDAEIASLPKGALCGLRRGKFGCEALVRRSQAGNIPLEPAGIEDIMVLCVKGVN